MKKLLQKENAMLPNLDIPNLDISESQFFYNILFVSNPKLGTAEMFGPKFAGLKELAMTSKLFDDHLAASESVIKILRDFCDKTNKRLSTDFQLVMEMHPSFKKTEEHPQVSAEPWEHGEIARIWGHDHNQIDKTLPSGPKVTANIKASIKSTEREEPVIIN